MQVTMRWIAVLPALLAALAAPAAAQSSWGKYAEPAEQPLEYDPAWEAYEFELPFADGEGTLSFTELAQTGDPLVVFFWSTDCPLCHLQLPYVQQLQNYIDDGELKLRIASICIDDRVDDCRDYLKEHQVTIPTLHDGHARKTDRKYKVRDEGTPLSYLFSAGGKYVDKVSGFRASYAKDVAKLLGLELPAAKAAD